LLKLAKCGILIRGKVDVLKHTAMNKMEVKGNGEKND